MFKIYDSYDITYSKLIIVKTHLFPVYHMTIKFLLIGSLIHIEY